MAFIFCGTFPSPHRRVFVFFFHGLIRRRFNASDLPIWALIARPSNWSVFPLAAIWLSAGSIVAYLLLNFLPRRSSVFRYLSVRSRFFWESSNVILLICSCHSCSCCGKFHQVAGSFDRRFLSLLLIIRRTSFSEELVSGFPFRHQSDSGSVPTVPVTIRCGSVFIRNCLSLASHLYLCYP